MKKEIDIILLPETKRFLNQSPDKIKDKFSYVFLKTSIGYRGDWFKKLSDTDGIFEFRIRASLGFYRVFAFWDDTLKTKTLIVCTHGLKKKTNKTPKTEIKRAERIKKKYFNSN